MAETPKEIKKRQNLISKASKEELKQHQEKKAALQEELNILKEMGAAGLKLTKTQQKRYDAIVKSEKKEKASLKRKEKKLKQEVKLAKLDKDHTKNLNKVAQTNRKNQGFAKNMFGMSQRRNDLARDNLTIIKEQNASGAIQEDLANTLTEATMDITSGSMDVLGLKDQQIALEQSLVGLDEEKDASAIGRIKDTLALNQAEQSRLNLTESINDALSKGDSLIGGMGGEILSMVNNPLSAAVALLLAFNAQQEAIGDEFGAIGVTEFRQDLAGASQEFVKMGLDGKEALTVSKQLSTEFGIGFAEATAMADSVGNIAKSTGMSTSEAAKLVGMFTEIGGLSEDGAESLAKQAESLAVANGVAPGAVLKDMAENSETFAKFSGTGAKGLMRAAIQARKLGVEFASIAGAAEGMLDFESSLNAEIEASVMLGRTINLQKARELSLAGDLEGFQTEILKQVGSQAEFDKMNLLQKKALATATGLSVKELSKMVSKEKEAATLAGELAKQDLSKIVPEETITATAELIGNLKAIGMSLAETLGPTLTFVVGAFGGLLGFVDRFVGIGPALLGLFVALKANAMKAAIAQIYNAVAGYFNAASLMSTATMGFGTLVAVGAAAAAVGMMYSALSSSPAGDLNSPADGKTQISTKEGGLFNMSKNDDILAGPGLSAAMAGVGAGGGGTTNVTNVDTSGIEKGTQQTVAAVNTLVDKFESAFGFGGSAAKQIGARVGTNVNESRR